MAEFSDAHNSVAELKAGPSVSWWHLANTYVLIDGGYNLVSDGIIFFMAHSEQVWSTVVLFDKHFSAIYVHRKF